MGGHLWVLPYTPHHKQLPPLPPLALPPDVLPFLAGVQFMATMKEGESRGFSFFLLSFPPSSPASEKACLIVLGMGKEERRRGELLLTHTDEGGSKRGEGWNKKGKCGSSSRG